jgi:tripartite ATP-independent transporter DctP family solute receptor
MEGKNLKRTLALLLALMMVFALVGCGSSSSEEEGNAEVEPMTLTLSHHCSETDSNHVLATAFADAVNELSEGTMKVEIYANGQLFGQSDALAALRQGTLDIALSDTALFANYAPAASIFDLPYMFNSREHAINAVKNTELTDTIADMMVESAGIRPITIEPLNFRNSLVKDTSIDSFDDFKNIKMRTPESPTIIAAFKAFGANPTVIPSGEAYTAVQTGVADGLEGHAEYVDLQKFYEVATNYVQTQHVMTFTSFSISEKVYQDMTEDQQTIIDEAADIALDKFLEYTDTLFEEKYQALEDKGVLITEVDLAPFKASVKDYVDGFIVENDCQDLYDMIQALDEE